MTRSEELAELRDQPRPAPETALGRAVASALGEAQSLLDFSNREQKTDEGPVLATWLGTLFQAEFPDAQIEFIAVVNPETLEFLENISGEAFVALGVNFQEERVADGVHIRRLR